jgi:hypothetical protein
MNGSPRGLRGSVTFRPDDRTPTDAHGARSVQGCLHAPVRSRGARPASDTERKGVAMTTIILTGLPTVHPHLAYHRRLGRYLLQLCSDGVTVEFLLSGEEVRRLLDELGSLAADLVTERAQSEVAVSAEEGQ